MSNETPVERFTLTFGSEMLKVVLASDYDKLKALYDELRWRMDGLEK